MNDSFQDFYKEMYPHLYGEWGEPGELMKDVQNRVVDALSKYLSKVIEEVFKDVSQEI